MYFLLVQNSVNVYTVPCAPEEQCLQIANALDQWSILGLFSGLRNGDVIDRAESRCLG